MPSPANWSRDGTIAALRAEIIKKVATIITESPTIKTGLVARMEFPQIGANSKSAELGGVKPPSEPSSRTDKVKLHLFVTLKSNFSGIGHSWEGSAVSAAKLSQKRMVRQTEVGRGRATP